MSMPLKISLSIILNLLLTYALVPIVMIIKNKLHFTKAIDLLTYDFTYLALINGYPLAYQSLLIAFVISCVVCTIPLFLSAGHKNLHGQARFARFNEIKKMNLFGEKGIIIGKKNGKFLRFGGQQFVAL